MKICSDCRFYVYRDASNRYCPNEGLRPYCIYFNDWLKEPVFSCYAFFELEHPLSKEHPRVVYDYYGYKKIIKNIPKR